MAMKRVRVPARTYVVAEWPKHAIERLQSWVPDLDALADACGQPRGSVVFADGSLPSVATRIVRIMDIEPGALTVGRSNEITTHMAALFGEPKRDKDFRLYWTVPADWTYES